MSKESEGAKVALLIIKGAISEFSEEERKTINTIADDLRNLIASSPLGSIALALIGAEMAAKEE